MSRKRPRKAKTGATRPTTSEEWLRLATGAAQWLDEGISRFDQGEERAIELVASRLRLLIGNGDRLLMRLCRDLGIPEPRLPAGTPASNNADVSIAIGGLPVTADDSPAVTIGRFAHLRCLVADNGAGVRRSFTWSQLVSDAANKLLGVHADDELPVIFDEIAAYEFGGVRAVPFMIRTAGVAILDAAAAVLHDANIDFTPSGHGYAVNGITISAVVVRGRL